MADRGFAVDTLDTFQKIITINGTFRFEYRTFRFCANETSYYDQFFVTMDNFLETVRNTRNLTSIHLGPLKCPQRGTCRELIFDFDATDYGDVRTCDCTSSACSTCWPFVQIAAHCTHWALINSLGIDASNIYWFFSGNRGLHCFVTDVTYVHNSAPSRAAIVAFLQHKDSHLSVPQVSLLATIRKHYDTVLRPLNNSKLSKEASSLTDGEILQICWPRMDVRVTADLKHLLRCPFSVNQKTDVCTRLVDNDLLSYVPREIRSTTPEEQ